MISNQNNTNSILKNIININIKQFFLLILLFYVLSSVLINWYVITDEMYYQSFGDQLSTDLINKFLNIKNKWDWIGFFIAPILLIVKILFVGICLEVGNFIFDLKLNFKQLIKIVILAETVFLIAAFVRVFWFFLYPENITLEYIQTFYPLTLLNLVVIKNVPQYLIYPLQLINFFELMYWFVLAYLLKTYTNKPFNTSFGVVAKTYGVGLLSWVVLVVFLSVK